MWESFKQFLQDIKPTRKGIGAIALILLAIPVVCDLFLLCFKISYPSQESFFLTPFIALQSIGFIPILTVYLLIFFIISFIIKQLLNK
jgi:hypothetical protein